MKIQVVFTDEASIRAWAAAQQAAIEVESWPEWKRCMGPIRDEDESDRVPDEGRDSGPCPPPEAPRQ